MHLSYAGEVPLVMSGESARQENIQYRMIRMLIFSIISAVIVALALYYFV